MRCFPRRHLRLEGRWSGYVWRCVRVCGFRAGGAASRGLAASPGVCAVQACRGVWLEPEAPELQAALRCVTVECNTPVRRASLHTLFPC